MIKESRRQFQHGPLSVGVYESREELGKAAAQAAAGLIQKVIVERGRARLLFSAANSQLDMVANLTTEAGIDWSVIEIFHVDEYVGLPPSHPASFAGWVKRNVVEKVHSTKTQYISGNAKDLAGECRRYAQALVQNPIDISFLGIGENGHIGFNDPHAADFLDPEIVKIVTLDEKCRQQQVEEGHWPNFASVPTMGITVTCPALVNAKHIICCVPGAQKAAAVRDALEGPIATACPASILRTHSDVGLYLDVASASLLAREE